MSLYFEKGILTILILSCLVVSGHALLCYGCQYETCGDHYNTKKYANELGECDDDQFCVKYKTVVWIKDSGDILGNRTESSVVTRSCESKKGKKEGCIGWQNNGGITLKCWCGTDGCNSGRSLKPILGYSFLVFVAGLFMTVFSLNH